MWLGVGRSRGAGGFRGLLLALPPSFGGWGFVGLFVQGGVVGRRLGVGCLGLVVGFLYRGVVGLVVCLPLVGLGVVYRAVGLGRGLVLGWGGSWREIGRRRLGSRWSWHFVLYSGRVGLYWDYSLGRLLGARWVLRSRDILYRLGLLGGRVGRFAFDCRLGGVLYLPLGLGAGSLPGCILPFPDPMPRHGAPISWSRVPVTWLRSLLIESPWVPRFTRVSPFGLVSRLVMAVMSVLLARLPLLTIIVVLVPRSLTVPQHRRPLVIPGSGTRTVVWFIVLSLVSARVLVWSTMRLVVVSSLGTPPTHLPMIRSLLGVKFPLPLRPRNSLMLHRFAVRRRSIGPRPPRL